MKKIVVNKCFGGFGLSLKGLLRYAELKGLSVYPYKQVAYKYQDSEDRYDRMTIDEALKETPRFGLFVFTEDFGPTIVDETFDDSKWLTDIDIQRDDPALVQVVEELGEEANGGFADLHITEIPDDVLWTIGEYDGQEWVAEQHRTW